MAVPKGLLGYAYARLGRMRDADTLRDPFFHSEGLASPIFDPLRSDRRFGELVERLHLERARLVTR